MRSENEQVQRSHRIINRKLGFHTEGMKKHIGQMGRGLKGFVTGRPELKEQNVMDEWAQYKLSTTRSTDT